MLPSVLAVLAVTALITSLAVWRGEAPTATKADRSSSAARPSTSATTGAARTSSSPATSSAATRAATGSTGSPTPPATTSTSSAAAVTAVRRTAAVVVLNQTARQGLAGTVAATLRGKGWSVPAVGNFRGAVPATTVYYPVGMADQAQAAAADLPVPPRVRPAITTLSQAHLTVVVTSSYPG